MVNTSTAPQRGASAEILRLALQRMAEHEAHFVPNCYAVWYEYLRGGNARLRQAVDAWLAQGKPMDDAAIDYFYRNYLSECNVEQMQQLRQDAQRILGDMAQQAQQATSLAHDYDGKLEQSAQRLSEPADYASLREMVQHLQHDTRGMREAVHALQDSLSRSQKEIEALRRELESAREEILSDPLTGVLNRRGFLGRMQEMLEQGSGLHLLMLDIDHFKQVNDSYGHLFGDKVIRAVAAACQSIVGKSGCVARLGGEEFGLLLYAETTGKAWAAAEKVRASIEKSTIRRTDNQQPIGGITISVGVTPYHAGEDPMQFIDRADRALYLSKQGGRNRTSVIEE